MGLRSAAWWWMRGRFDWENSGRFPRLTEPDPGLHNIDFTEEFGPSAYIVRARLEGLRDFGAVLSPTIAFQFLQGLETLPLRMLRHVENAQHIARFLAGNEAVERVTYPRARDARRLCAGSAPDAEGLWGGI